MLNFLTSPVIVGDGASRAAREYISGNFGGANNLLAVCDANTESIASSEFPGAERYVFPGDALADPELAAKLDEYAKKKRVLAAVGSGTVHDLTRYTAYKLGVPFVSFPTAPSVDGFVSGVAAMTVGGQKLSFPSAPPAALFAEPGVFMSAPPALTAAGVGDILGKYISLCDWKISNILTGERWDSEVATLEQRAVDNLVAASPGDHHFGVLLMEALVTSGLAIQAYGNSRPASGAEHHLSHMWEMHLINAPTDALHGEKVGVSTLLLLDRYRALDKITLRNRFYTTDCLSPVFGPLTDGIIRENLPDPLDGLTPEHAGACFPEIRAALNTLPDPRFVRDYMAASSCKLGLASIGLPDSPEFICKTLEFAPYVRKRVTLLKLCVIS